MKRRILVLLALAPLALGAAARISNINIASNAAIAWSKMAALTASRVMITDGSGNASASSVTSTVLAFIANLSSDAQTQLDAKQTLDADLTALAGNSTDGFWAHTGSGTGAARTLTAPAAGFTITNPAGIAGNPTFVLANDLLALEGLSGSNVIPYRSGTDAWGTISVSSDLTFLAGALSLTPPVSSDLTTATVIDWSKTRQNGGVFTKTLSGNTTLTFANVNSGQTIVIAITNTASNYTVTWPTTSPVTVKWPSNTIPTETVGAKTDIISCVHMGAFIGCNSVQNF